MAFAVASKRAPLAVAGLLKKLLLAAPSASGSQAAALRPACAIAARRLFSTGRMPFRRDGLDLDSEEEYSGDDEEHNGNEGVVYDRLPADVVDPIGEPMSLGRMMALMKDEAEDGDAVKLNVALPGLRKEHVKVWAEKDVLVIKGERNGDGDKGSKARYSYRIELSSQAFKMDQIKAEMENGLLTLTVPKIKDEERKDVFEIKIE